MYPYILCNILQVAMTLCKAIQLYDKLDLFQCIAQKSSKNKHSSFRKKRNISFPCHKLYTNEMHKQCISLVYNL
jgi:hypothetical protein